MSDGRRATGDGGWGNRRGFTFVELMTVIIILGLLAGISILKYIDLRNAARAAEVAVAVVKGEKVETTAELDNGAMKVPSIFEKIISVDKDNLQSTVVADGFHSAESLK